MLQQTATRVQLGVMIFGSLRQSHVGKKKALIKLHKEIAIKQPW